MLTSQARIARPQTPSNGMLSGTLPAELANLAALGALDLSASKLSGSLPVALATLTELKELNLFR